MICRILAVHVLHRHVVAAAGLAGVVHANDVGMLEQEGDVRLGQKQIDGIAIALELAVQTLDDDGGRALLLAIAVGEEDLGHAALSDFADECVRTEALLELDWRTASGHIAPMALSFSEQDACGKSTSTVVPSPGALFTAMLPA